MDMAGTGIDTAVLTTLGAAFGVMFATLTTLMVSSIRVQHRESTQTRELTRQLIEQASEKNRELIEKATERLTTDFNEHKRVTERNHETVVDNLKNVTASLGDARERLARIEGVLRVGLPTTTDPESNGGTSEAA